MDDQKAPCKLSNQRPFAICQLPSSIPQLLHCGGLDTAFGGHLISGQVGYRRLDIFAMTYSSFGDDADQPRVIEPSEANWQYAPTPGYFGRTPETS
ncbi:hypothetical protein N7451_008212 [Penicillium sp. IBT 35674x]|nr:hypothetical protein N7451_008212 [Penicillium sp. IBT 35674x]